MSLKELARSVLMDRDQVAPELRVSNAAFVAKDSRQSDDILDRTFGTGHSLTRHDIARGHREIASRLVPPGIVGVMQNREERQAGIVAGRLYGTTDAELAAALKEVPGIEDVTPPRQLGDRALWVRDLVLRGMRDGSFEPSSVTDAPALRSDVRSERDESDRKRIEADFGRRMNRDHYDAFDGRYEGVVTVAVDGESTREAMDRIADTRVRLDQWRRDLAAARLEEPRFTQYDAARSEYSKLVSPDLETGVPENARFSSDAGFDGRRLDAMSRDPRRIAWEARSQDVMNDQPRLDSVRRIVDEHGRMEGGPSSVLANALLRLDAVTMFDPIDREGSKSIVQDGIRAFSSRARGPASRVPVEASVPARSGMER
jgi:hypothetical protein